MSALSCMSRPEVSTVQLYAIESEVSALQLYVMSVFLK